MDKKQKQKTKTKLLYIYAMEHYAAKRKKELLPFTTARMELESIMLSEISQVVKDKYHMISPISGAHSTKQTMKQNITRDIEIIWGGPSRNMYKGHIDNTKWGRFESGRQGCVG